MVYSTQTIRHKNREGTQPLAASFRVHPQQRTSANPYGMLITDFAYVDYKGFEPQYRDYSEDGQQVSEQQTEE